MDDRPMGGTLAKISDRKTAWQCNQDRELCDCAPFSDHRVNETSEVELPLILPVPQILR